MIPDEVLIILMFLVLMAGLIFLGAHVGFMLGVIAVIAGFIGWGGTDFLHLFPIAIFGIMSSFVLVAIPLFIFMGFMLERSGFAEDLFAGVETLFGRFRGGLAITVIVITTMVAACTGIVATGVIMAGVFALPSMLRRGYDKHLVLGTVAAGGTLGILIPPSVMLVFYASLSGLSVGKLFLGAIPSGLILSGLYMTYIAVITNLRPKLAPLRGEVPEDETYGGPPVTDPSKLRMFGAFVSVLCLILAVLGTIIFGIATPTEAAAAGGGGAILLAAIYRKLTLGNLVDASFRTAEIMGIFGGIIIGAICFSRIFSGLGGRQIVYNLLVGLDIDPIGVLVIMLGIVIFMGMFLDDLAILVILLPTFMPIAGAFGWHPIWFALVFCTTMQTAWLTPPFGYALFLLRGLHIPKILYADIIIGCAPFVVLQLIGVAILIAFPKIVTYLPTLLIK